MPIFILSILIQVAFVVHVIKTGRNTIWIWVVILLPMAGSIAYFILEILPDLTNSRAGRSANRKIQSVVNPNKGLNQAAQQYAISDSVDNSKKLAEECVNKGLYAEAKTLYVKCLKGLHADDPNLLFGLANAEFMLANYKEAKAVLDTLIEKNPSYKNQEAHLLYARTLENLNEVSSALHEYETLHNYYNGPEASFHYGMFLKTQNLNDKAKEIFGEILKKADLQGKHYKTLHKDIIKNAKNEMQ